MKVIRLFAAMIAAAALACSCATPKNISYLQDMRAGSEYQIPEVKQIRLMPEDKVSILVSSKDPQLASVFNLLTANRQIYNDLMTTTSSSGRSAVRASGQSNGVASYTVAQDGTIDFPVIGKMKIAGMTRTEIQDYVKEELITRDLLKDPNVTVEFLNLTITVMGEVKLPGRYSVDKDHVTILDAIGMAGDINILGRRENVMITRTENGVQKTYEVDMTNGSSLFNSPVFYLQQNDIVYVEPNNRRAREATVNGNTLTSVNFWMSSASLLMSVVTFVRLLN